MSWLQHLSSFIRLYFLKRCIFAHVRWYRNWEDSRSGTLYLDRKPHEFNFFFVDHLVRPAVVYFIRMLTLTSFHFFLFLQKGKGNKMRCDVRVKCSLALTTGFEEIKGNQFPKFQLCFHSTNWSELDIVIQSFRISLHFIPSTLLLSTFWIFQTFWDILFDIAVLLLGIQMVTLRFWQNRSNTFTLAIKILLISINTNWQEKNVSSYVYVTTKLSFSWKRLKI